MSCMTDVQAVTVPALEKDKQLEMAPKPRAESPLASLEFPGGDRMNWRNEALRAGVTSFSPKISKPV